MILGFQECLKNASLYYQQGYFILDGSKDGALVITYLEHPVNSYLVLSEGMSEEITLMTNMTIK